MELTDEFGTPDRLPPKPYVREGLRLEALYMLAEQDIRAATRKPKWAKVMPPDAVFGFQFNIDFHPTRRQFLETATDGPVGLHPHARRATGTPTPTAPCSPLRSLVPVERDGLLGASKNIGVSSIVQSALRLHGQMMLVRPGQRARSRGMCLRDWRRAARSWRADFAKVRELQRTLVRGVRGPGVLLWPWQDLRPDDLWFEAANMLAVLGIWQADADSVDFAPGKSLPPRELSAALTRLGRALVAPKEWTPPADSSPDAQATWGTLHAWLTSLGLPADKGLARQKDRRSPAANACASCGPRSSRRASGSPPRPGISPPATTATATASPISTTRCLSIRTTTTSPTASTRRMSAEAASMVPLNFEYE